MKRKAYENIDNPEQIVDLISAKFEHKVLKA